MKPKNIIPHKKTVTMPFDEKYEINAIKRLPPKKTIPKIRYIEPSFLAFYLFPLPKTYNLLFIFLLKYELDFRLLLGF
jgi:hypothetical protein